MKPLPPAIPGVLSFQEAFDSSNGRFVPLDKFVALLAPELANKRNNLKGVKQRKPDPLTEALHWIAWIPMQGLQFAQTGTIAELLSASQLDEQDSHTLGSATKFGPRRVPDSKFHQQTKAHSRKHLLWILGEYARHMLTLRRELFFSAPFTEGYSKAVVKRITKRFKAAMRRLEEAHPDTRLSCAQFSDSPRPEVVAYRAIDVAVGLANQLQKAPTKREVRLRLIELCPELDKEPKGFWTKLWSDSGLSGLPTGKRGKQVRFQKMGKPGEIVKSIDLTKVDRAVKRQRAATEGFDKK